MSFVRKVVALLLSLLGFALAVVLPWYLYVRGSLDSLTSAFTVGSSIVIAEFTMALWWATQAQARATEGMRRLEQQLASLETRPLVAITDVALFETVRPVGEKSGGIGVLDEPDHSSMEVRFKVSNVGRYGLVIKTASLFVLGGEGACCPIRLSPAPEGVEPVVAPGKSAMFRAGNKQAHKYVYQLFRSIEDCLASHNRISGAWGCVGLAFEVVHGGSLGESEWLCFELSLRAKTKGEYRAVGYQSACPKNTIVKISKTKLLA